MAVGFESYNPNGKLQFSAEFTYVQFKRKGSVKGGDAIIKIPLDPTNEFVCFSCSTHGVSLSFYDTVNSEVGFMLDKTVGNESSAVIYYWVFGQKTISDSGFGFQLFSAGDNLKYDAVSMKLMNPVGVAGLGTTSFQSGRSYAALPMTFKTITQIFIEYLQQDPAFVTVAERTQRFDGVVKISGNQVIVQDSKMVFEGVRIYETPPPAPSQGAGQISSNNSSTSYLVVDVTDL